MEPAEEALNVGPKSSDLTIEETLIHDAASGVRNREPSADNQYLVESRARRKVETADDGRLI